MRIAITGAAGFVGQAVVRQLRQSHSDVDLLLADRAFTGPSAYPTLVGDLTDPAIVRALCSPETDILLHLAALPGGAAERDPQASRAINLDVPLAFIEAMEGRRLILAGSIAVFGGTLPTQVDDTTPPAPASVYGAHKYMVEIAFADAVRRGAIQGMVLRLPGIVARPAAAGGFGSAFLSDIFHAAKAGPPLCHPRRPRCDQLASVRPRLRRESGHRRLERCDRATSRHPPRLAGQDRRSHRYARPLRRRTAIDLRRGRHHPPHLWQLSAADDPPRRRSRLSP
tara:strand:- start:10327 stop:11175 length:849 start_codon:yes stop_codon:yes gene_type:complete